MNPVRFVVVSLALSALQLSPAIAGDPSPQDALKLADEGKISLDAVAHGAYSVQVRVRNQTNEELNVSFPPGLVADTYARFALFQVGGGGGTSGGGGGQSTAILMPQLAPVNAKDLVVLNFQAACLNFGAPEPTPKTVLMLKRVEDFTADVVLQQLIKDLAASPAEEHVAQAALWNVVDSLDWKKIAKIRTRRGRFSPEDLEQAQLRVSAAASSAASARRSGANSQAAPSARLPALSVLVHPDPRGRLQDAELARLAARNLRDRWPGVDVAHRDFTPTPKIEDADAVAWCFLVRSVGNAKTPDLQFTPQRNVWSGDKKRWKHEAIQPSFNRTPPSTDVGPWLADLMVQYIASRSLVVEKKDDDRLLVRNAAPIALQDVLVTTGPKDPALKLIGLALEPGESKEMAVPAKHAERFGAAKKIVAAGFTPTFEKASGG